MINFLVQLATDGVYRKHFLTLHSFPYKKCQTSDSLWCLCPHTHHQTSAHTYKQVQTQSCILLLPLALAFNGLPCRRKKKSQSCVSIARDENGPESCLKWGTVVYKKHAHLLKYFIGKRLIVPLRCISFLHFFFSHPQPMWHRFFSNTLCPYKLLSQCIVKD